MALPNTLPTGIATALGDPYMWVDIDVLDLPKDVQALQVVTGAKDALVMRNNELLSALLTVGSVHDPVCNYLHVYVLPFLGPFHVPDIKPDKHVIGYHAATQLWFRAWEYADSETNASNSGGSVLPEVPERGAIASVSLAKVLPNELP